MASGVEGILGRKVGMTQVFREDGEIVPVTVLQAGPCVVVGRKTRERDGYEAVQLGLVEKFSKARMTKPIRGFYDKAKVAPLRTMREFRFDGEGVDVGESVRVDLFNDTGFVDVVGESKGKGFAGVMKRHKFSGGRATHGSMFHRAPGSIGQSACPSRVFKGMRMPGQMGSKRVTVKNLEVVQVDVEKNLLMVKGAVPGARGSLLMIRKAREVKRG